MAGETLNRQLYPAVMNSISSTRRGEANLLLACASRSYVPDRLRLQLPQHGPTKVQCDVPDRQETEPRDSSLRLPVRLVLVIGTVIGSNRSFTVPGSAASDRTVLAQVSPADVPSPTESN
jgi:hypothetical protein